LVEDRRQQSPVQQTVNLGDANNGFLGLTGIAKSVANFSAVVILCGMAVWLVQRTVDTDRMERLEDRQLFRQAVKDLNDESNRRTGESKGSTDKLIEVVRDNSNLIRQWIEESRRSRADHGPAPKSAELKPTSPP
jgi:hypothetical protein